MKITILSILTALAAFPQAQTPLRVFNSAGSSTGAVWLQERRTNGANWIKLEAPQSIAADFSLIFPSAAPAGNDYCLVSSTAGVMSFIACSQNAFVQNGNSFGATAFLGTNDNFAVAIETNATQRWTFGATGHLTAASNNTYDIGAGVSANSPRNVYAATSMVTPKIGRDTSASLTFFSDSIDRFFLNSAGMVVPSASVTYDLGLTGTRWRTLYAQAGEFYIVGGSSASDYVSARKYNIMDYTGSGVGAWDMQALVSGSTSTLFWRDNSGDPWIQANRLFVGSPANFAYVYSDWLPAKRDTGDGHTVTDATYPKLGLTGRRWAELWVDDATFTDDVAIGDALLVTGNAVLSGASNTMSGTMAPGFAGLGSIGTSSYPYGALWGLKLDISNYAGALNEVTSVARQYNYQASSDSGAFKAEGWQLSGTGSNVRGAESHAACAEIASDAFSAPTCANVWGLEVGIRTNRTPASSSSNVGIYVNSDSAGWLAGADLNCNSVGTTRGCRNGIGVMVSGSDGWEKPFAYYDDVSSLLWYVNLSGVTVMSGFNMGPGAASGLVLTSDGSGNGTWAASTVTAPLTLSLAANAYSEPLFIQNPSHGAFGACMVMNTSDTVSTIYKTGRICSRFESASFTDELLTIQTTTNGSNGWDVALSIKNLVVTVPGTFVSGPASISSLTMAGSQTPGLDSLGNVGTPSVRYGSMATYNLNAGGGSGVITFLPGAAPAVGYVWTASSTAGVGGWAAAGGQWTTVGSDIYRNSFIGIGDFSSISISAPIHISYGSSAAMFFDGLGAFAPNFLMRHSNGTAASPTASVGGDRLGQFAVQGYGTSRVTTAGVGFFAEATHTGSSAPTKISFSTTAGGSTTRAVRWDIEGAGNILPVASTTYNIGSTANKVLDIHTSFIDLYTDLTFNSGATFTGDMVPSVSNVYSVGNTSFRLSGVVTTALNVTGAVTTPVGSAGYSGNVSVRNAADTGSCTLSFSGGWLYAATGC